MLCNTSQANLSLWLMYMSLFPLWLIKIGFFWSWYTFSLMIVPALNLAEYLLAKLLLTKICIQYPVWICILSLVKFWDQGKIVALSPEYRSNPTYPHCPWFLSSMWSWPLLWAVLTNLWPTELEALSFCKEDPNIVPRLSIYHKTIRPIIVQACNQLVVNLSFFVDQSFPLTIPKSKYKCHPTLYIASYFCFSMVKPFVGLLCFFLNFAFYFFGV